MSNVLIRDVPEEDLDQLRSAAAERGMSLQRYLRDAVHDQAAYLRRQAALERAGARLHGRPGVSPEDRDAISDAIDDAHADRADRLSGGAQQ